MMEREIRDRKHPLKVVVSARERAIITANAEASRLTVSAFLRNLGTGGQPLSRFDRETLRTLIRLHAEQDCLNGILKEWLSERTGTGVAVPDVRAVLSRIEGLQTELAGLVMAEKRRL